MNKYEKLKLVYLLIAIFGILTFVILTDPFNGTLKRLAFCNTSNLQELDSQSNDANSFVRFRTNLIVIMILVTLVYLMFSIYEMVV